MSCVDMDFAQLMDTFRKGEITHVEFGDILNAQVIKSQRPFLEKANVGTPTVVASFGATSTYGVCSVASWGYPVKET